MENEELLKAILLIEEGIGICEGVDIMYFCKNGVLSEEEELIVERAVNEAKALKAKEGLT